MLQFASSLDNISGLKNCKTMKGSMFKTLDETLSKWFQQKRAEGVPISGPILIKHAQIFHETLRLSQPFSASNGWFAWFKLVMEFVNFL